MNRIPILNLRLREDLLIHQSVYFLMLPKEKLQKIYEEKGGDGVESFCIGFIEYSTDLDFIEYKRMRYLMKIYPFRGRLNMTRDKFKILFGGE